MKISIKYLVGMCALLLVNYSCQDSFLDEKVLDALAPETLNDKLGYDAAAVGLYNSLSSTFYTTDQDQTFLGMFQLGTDIMWAPSGRSNGLARPYFDYSQLNSTDWGASKVWNGAYKIINNANIIINNAESGNAVGMSQDEIKAFNGEGRFFRAYAYNMLATLYGGVPLVLVPIDDAKTDFTRASLDEVNTAIVTDLEKAVANLPEVDKAAYAGRANKNMARQLLAEVYLRIGKPDLAEKRCDTIINSGKYSLVKNRYGVRSSEPGDAFSDMFINGNQRRSQGNTEAIWVLEQENPTDVTGGSTGWPQQRRVWGASYHDLPGMEPTDTLGGRGLGRIRLDNWVLYNLYDDGDMRNSKYSIHRQHYFNNTNSKYDDIRGLPVPYGQDVTFTLPDASEVKIFAADTIYKNAPYILKWGQFDPRDVFGYGQFKDFIIMRLGETYLLRAEARFKQSDFDGAAQDINVLRDRAHAPFVDAGDITLDFILDERARELIGEENRRITLVRTGTLVERAKRLNGTAPLAGGNIETTNGLQDYNVLLPIPQSEIDLNKDAVLEQNPGY
ncbi:RagB/SusD family nutrient uptake outer membrane protein [Confluentibacter sediminis]|uniref:RagB/SusD family nutrient uptake outer membrane protein n=1 Tax=Confluentibacter sediminis TaxID=2219045 RepID=UPI000DAE879E|nr:RagB/SusD family nutrient uptake outer membrane protein [Confluentibacter sediminis]